MKPYPQVRIRSDTDPNNFACYTKRWSNLQQRKQRDVVECHLRESVRWPVGEIEHWYWKGGGRSHPLRHSLLNGLLCIPAFSIVSQKHLMYSEKLPFTKAADSGFGSAMQQYPVSIWTSNACMHARHPLRTCAPLKH